MKNDSVNACSGKSAASHIVRDCEALHPMPLDKPVRITEQTWPDGTVPVVSVFCITYNHAKFIRDAIEGFLMQETTFPVEVFIHDDASTDETAEIVKEYSEKYPRLFWTVLQDENQWSRYYAPRGMFEKKRLGMGAVTDTYLANQRGEFIAMCEGDDYWTDPLKLEKQVGFLRSNRSLSAAFHRCRVVDDKKRKLSHAWDQINYKDVYTEKECLFSLRSAYATASLFFKKSSIRDILQRRYYLEVPCDHTLDVVIAGTGDLAFMDFEASAYRQHAGGMWSSSSSLQHHTMLARRFLAFMQDDKLRSAYRKELQEALFESYACVWWGLYSGGLMSWLHSYVKLAQMFPTLTHLALFVKYSARKNSVVRYTFLDSIKGAVERLLRPVNGR